MDEKMRAEFEAWAFLNIGGLDRWPDGSYRNEFMQTAWQAWQASRASLVVGLPTQCNEGDDYAEGWNNALGWSKAAIEVVGVRVNP